MFLAAHSSNRLSKGYVERIDGYMRVLRRREVALMSRIMLLATAALMMLLVLAVGAAYAADISCPASGACFGTASGDTLRENPAAPREAFYSDGGNDTILANTVGNDTDAVYAGGGNDTVNVKDGDMLDVVVCGFGEDTVTADAGDVVSPDCEHVTR